MLLHLHIPRTGGKSVVKWLRQLLPSPDATYNFKNYKSFWDDVLGLGDKPYDLRQLKLVTGHFHYGIDAYFGPHIGYVVVLRDPVDRVKSLIRYIRKNGDHRLHELFAKSDDINHIFGNIRHSPQFSNGQVRQLCCYDLAGLVRLSDTHVDKAMNQIAGDNVHVFRSEDLNNALRPMGDGLNIMSITRENNTEMDETCSWLNSEAVEAVIRENNELDIRLYDFAKKHLCTDASVLLPYVIEGQSHALNKNMIFGCNQ